MDRAGCWTNPLYLHDIIKCIVIPKQVDIEQIREMYVEKGLLARQIASQLGVSKAFVLGQLHTLGIRRDTIKNLPMARPRPAKCAPYGYRIVDGRLVENRKEMKIVRLLVELRGRQELSWSEVVQILNNASLKTRMGKLWNINSARAVYEKWKHKL